MNHSAVFWFVPFPDMPSIIWFIVNRRESYIEWHIELSWTIPCGLFSPEELNLDFIWPFFPKSMIPDSSRTTWSDTRTWIKSRVGHEGYLIAHLDQRNGFCCAVRRRVTTLYMLESMSLRFPSFLLLEERVSFANTRCKLCSLPIAATYRLHFWLFIPIPYSSSNSD